MAELAYSPADDEMIERGQSVVKRTETRYSIQNILHGTATDQTSIPLVRFPDITQWTETQTSIRPPFPSYFTNGKEMGSPTCSTKEYEHGTLSVVDKGELWLKITGDQRRNDSSPNRINVPNFNVLDMARGMPTFHDEEGEPFYKRDTRQNVISECLCLKSDPDGCAETSDLNKDRTSVIKCNSNITNRMSPVEHCHCGLDSDFILATGQSKWHIPGSAIKPHEHFTKADDKAAETAPLRKTSHLSAECDVDDGPKEQTTEQTHNLRDTILLLHPYSESNNINHDLKEDEDDAGDHQTMLSHKQHRRAPLVIQRFIRKKRSSHISCTKRPAQLSGFLTGKPAKNDECSDDHRSDGKSHRGSACDITSSTKTRKHGSKSRIFNAEAALGRLGDTTDRKHNICCSLTSRPPQENSADFGSPSHVSELHAKTAWPSEWLGGLTSKDRTSPQLLTPSGNMTKEREHRLLHDARTMKYRVNEVSNDNLSLTKSDVKVTLLNSALWKAFNNVGTEMIINRGGRRMFPYLALSVSGLVQDALYNVTLEILPANCRRFKYINSKWVPVGLADAEPAQTVYVHPDSPNTGHHFSKIKIIFSKVKLTNNKDSAEENILLHSMHKYRIVTTFKRIDSERNQPSADKSLSFSFPETDFIAVTAYQNEAVTQMKIHNNPFAKAFRDANFTTVRRNLASRRKRLSSSAVGCSRYKDTSRCHVKSPQAALVPAVSPAMSCLTAPLLQTSSISPMLSTIRPTSGSEYQPLAQSKPDPVVHEPTVPSLSFPYFIPWMNVYPSLLHPSLYSPLRSSHQQLSTSAAHDCDTKPDMPEDDDLGTPKSDANPRDSRLSHW